MDDVVDQTIADDTVYVKTRELMDLSDDDLFCIIKLLSFNDKKNIREICPRLNTIVMSELNGFRSQAILKISFSHIRRQFSSSKGYFLQMFRQSQLEIKVEILDKNKGKGSGYTSEKILSFIEEFKDRITDFEIPCNKLLEQVIPKLTKLKKLKDNGLHNDDAHNLSRILAANADSLHTFVLANNNAQSHGRFTISDFKLEKPFERMEVLVLFNCDYRVINQFVTKAETLKKIRVNVDGRWNNADTMLMVRSVIPLVEANAHSLEDLEVSGRIVDDLRRIKSKKSFPMLKNVTWK